MGFCSADLKAECIAKFHYTTDSDSVALEASAPSLARLDWELKLQGLLSAALQSLCLLVP